jgi:hypothetical protein
MFMMYTVGFLFDIDGFLIHPVDLCISWKIPEIQHITMSKID